MVRYGMLWYVMVCYGRLGLVMYACMYVCLYVCIVMLCYGMLCYGMLCMYVCM